ncbi:MAG: FAD/NAD(P)-binding oxidoreductase [Allgaiera sp.]|jgi:3-phenylpropionate/trans-cinnamate dioxygenase ferredoxin reductase subunit|nr:FAD/NAD(P)-binding oxidoreductase [Allgaiera sp.]
MTGIVIIGAGQAGASLAAKLRTLGYDGALTLIGEEPEAPYQRPPLSKQYLLGEMELERLFLRSDSYYAEQKIALRLGKPVTAIDLAAQTVTVGGEVLSYDQLALTTGATPRILPADIGGMLDGVHTVRRLADIDAMQHEFRAGAHLLVVGGGYIGLEAAAVAAKLGLKVTLLEAAPRILGRVACEETADYFRDLHASHGVEIREGVGLKRLKGESRVTGAELSDGSSLSVDFAIVGVGIRPETTLAEAAGLEVDNGICCNAEGRSSDPQVWAAGDCASFPGPSGRMRLESVGNAIDMAELVAENMLGAAKSYVAKPWFWSDQYDVKLQIAGLGAGADRIVKRADGAGMSHWYYAGDRLLAIDAMNDPRAYMVAKRLIEAGRSPAPEVVADPATELKALLKG